MTSKPEDSFEAAWPADGGTEHRAGARDEWRIVVGDDAVHLGKAEALRAHRLSRRELARLAYVRGVVGGRILLAFDKPLRLVMVLSPPVMEALRRFLGDAYDEFRTRSLRRGSVTTLVLGGLLLILLPLEVEIAARDVVLAVVFLSAGTAAFVKPSVVGPILQAVAWVVFMAMIAFDVFSSGAGYARLLVAAFGLLAVVHHLRMAAFFRRG